jgi:phage terminase small subunit
MKPGDDLTDKQRRFVELYESGEAGTMKQAYRIAFGNYTAKDTTISPKASRLMAKKKVRAYQDKLRRKAVDALLASLRDDEAEARWRERHADLLAYARA